MRKPSPFLASSLDRELLSRDGLQAGLSRQLRSAILGGLLKPGIPLPSTRELATELGIARQTVVQAYERLAAEGYVETRPGSATRVSRVLPEALLHVGKRALVQSTTGTQGADQLSSRGAVVARLKISPAQRGATLLATGIPALDHFPWRTWEKLSAEMWRGRPAGMLGYGDPRGDRSLRDAIAAYLAPMRGLTCDQQQIFITSGSQQAIDLAARVLSDVGDEAWVEEPAYVAGRNALVAAGLRTIPVPVDDEGIDSRIGENLAPNARLALVTPSHQYPLGKVMSLRRRLALLDWAERRGAWIVEDDYDSEYRYVGRPLEPLAALSKVDDRVIYVGTFSKVLAPALRLGFMVVPLPLVDAFTSARGLMDRQPPGPSQIVLAEFIARGHLAAHIRRMRRLYEERRDALMAALGTRARGELTADAPAGGLHLIALLEDDRLVDTEIYRRLARRGIQTPPLSAHYSGSGPKQGLVVGFANTSSDLMDDAVGTLVSAVRGLD